MITNLITNTVFICEECNEIIWTDLRHDKTDFDIIKNHRKTHNNKCTIVKKVYFAYVPYPDSKYIHDFRNYDYVWANTKDWIDRKI
jgi:hypothetical protein